MNLRTWRSCFAVDRTFVARSLDAETSLLSHQARALAELRAFAVARSPFSVAVERAGAQAIPIRVEHVAEIPRIAAGKAPLIRAQRR